MNDNKSRRSVLAGTGVAAAGLLGVGTQVSADGHDVPVVIESVTPQEDLIVLRNEGDSDVDLSGYVIRWLYNNPDNTQEDALPEGTVIEAGGSLRITSGYYETEADVEYDDQRGRINNDGTNTIALLTPSQQEEVSVYEGDGIGAGGDDSGSDEPEEMPADSDEEESESEEEPEEQSLPGEVEVSGEYSEYIDVAHDFPDQPIDERACHIETELTNTSEDRVLWLEVYVSTRNADGDTIDLLDDMGIILNPGDSSSGSYALDCEEDGSYVVSANTYYTEEFEPDEADPDDEHEDDSEPEDHGDESEDETEHDEPEDSHDETEEQYDDDCPDEEPEPEPEDDCPEEEPEPEPEDDDC